MATSEAAIANIALRGLKAQRISNLDDEPRVKDVFAEARDFVLTLHPWNFAQARQPLNVNATAPAFGFTYGFALPSDPYCLRAWKLNGTKDAFAADGDAFKIEGRNLLTDTSSANLLYIRRVTDVSLFSPGFVQALAAYLRWQLAYAFTGSDNKEESARAAWVDVLRQARAIDGTEGTLDSAPTSPFVTGRL